MNPAGAMAAAGWGPGAIFLVAVIATVGALLIHFLARRRSSVQPGPIRTSPVAVRPGEPDSALSDVHEAMSRAAGRMDIPERLLPVLSSPSGADGDFVFRDGPALVYCGFERGSQMFGHSADSLDDLLYLVFRDRAWARTYTSLIGQDLSPEDHAARLARGQLELLRKGDPRWAERLIGERDLASSSPSVQG